MVSGREKNIKIGRWEGEAGPDHHGTLEVLSEVRIMFRI